jgi:hypothetical protein
MCGKIVSHNMITPSDARQFRSAAFPDVHHFHSAMAPPDSAVMN